MKYIDLSGISTIDIIKCEECRYWERSADSFHGNCIMFKTQTSQGFFCGAGDEGKERVVHCYECRYWQDNTIDEENWCKWRTDETPDADDFCSCGELMIGGD